MTRILQIIKCLLLNDLGSVYIYGGSMDMEEPSKNNKIHIIWIITTIMLTIISFCVFTLITVYIDPLFHYHKPLQGYGYPLDNERYQNDGITRNFEYDSITTGTSMVENFKT